MNRYNAAFPLFSEFSVIQFSFIMSLVYRPHCSLKCNDKEWIQPSFLVRGQRLNFFLVVRTDSKVTYGFHSPVRFLSPHQWCYTVDLLYSPRGPPRPPAPFLQGRKCISAFPETH